MKKFSLHNRLIAAVVSSQILLALGLAVVGATFSRHYIQSAFDVYLEDRAQSIAALVSYTDDRSPGFFFDGSRVPPSPHQVHKDIYLVRTEHSNFERHTANYDPSLFAKMPANVIYWDLSVGGEPYRAIVLHDLAILDTPESKPGSQPRLTVIYAAPKMDIPQQITVLATTIGLASLGLLIPSLVLAIWSIRRALTPLDHLASAARRISVTSWHFEPSEEAKSTAELEPLIAAIETVLKGLQLAFTRQREFLGDAAHELKTSLAILKSTLQALQNKRRETDEYLRGLALMSSDCDRLERLLSRMLQTARAEERVADGVQCQLGLVDLASTCELAIARIAKMAAARDIRIEFSSSGVAMLRADSADLELVWINLLENAVQYSAVGSSVSMTLKVLDGVAEVCVADAGCGIPAAQLPHIFQRFYRADPSRSRATGGFGLGLAIARSIVVAYKGVIRADSEVGEGTRITVALAVLSPEAIASELEELPALSAEEQNGI